MKKSELRIGNNAYLKLETSQDTLVTICATDLMMLEEGKRHLLPIPITSEWLERFGFYCLSVGVFERITRSMDMRFRILKVSGNLFIIGNYESSARPIQYVHQLQNLYFALTGEELNQHPDNKLSNDSADNKGNNEVPPS